MSPSPSVRPTAPTAPTDRSRAAAAAAGAASSSSQHLTDSLPEVAGSCLHNKSMSHGETNLNKSVGKGGTVKSADQGDVRIYSMCLKLNKSACSWAPGATGSCLDSDIDQRRLWGILICYTVLLYFLSIGFCINLQISV